MRAFVGTNNKDEILSFDEMEKDENSVIVWIFPRAGERYHGPECSYINNEPKEVQLVASVRRDYAPCELCKPESVSDGNLVYCFSKSGKAYHLGSCFLVERYVIPIDEDEAKGQGYSSCSKCGGH
jgi:hypothetical protein